ncbi:cobyrinic acid a,c-diamide synthase (plasmid) [Halarchaeum sp. CBA1220]|uniref:cobyrinic acid a,c-diamide synthase n=1 Tax=Halarchaeum sp. CBA1220 TaxID=1853682 RepID=UPI000F3A902B|nr:cobyrinic acid a,c-diamide synthase [Halarchaeum sp. CBA1220]QLC35265.1 cobyrinic acid a,c-diamide synthase [Halarchaeum sp. CBA1220]
MNGIVLAGTASGVGKTVATLAVCRALERAGHTVQAAKAGPDFIDPSHHEAVTGRPSRTLDPWLEGRTGMRRNYYRAEDATATDSGGAPDVCVVEGMMGLYDGSVASTADVAAALDLPVVLVVDASAGMQSVAASALGFREYAAHADADVDVVGVLAQRAHGGRHADGIRDALPESLTYYGRVPPRDDLEIPERHLGLERGTESPLGDEALDAAAESIRTQRLLDAARAPPRPDPEPASTRRERTVAVARDAAFCFAYPAVLERLRERAHVATFSPLAGDALPDCDAVYLPGGYPELHAADLADAPALDALARRASDGLPVLGECGGLMALCESLTTTDGDTYDMAGVLPADVRMHERYQALDHVALRARDDGLTAADGETQHGHEYHYSSLSPDADARFAFDVVRGTGIDDDHDGLTEHETVGTYCHRHAASGAFDRLTDSL